MKYIKRMSAVTLPIALSAVFMLPASAQTPEEKGFEIAARSDRSDVGFKSSEVELNMELKNAAGESSTRSLRIATLEKPNEDVGDKSLVLFETPNDIQGTALLSHAKILDPDDQWLYLPALKRIKRISSSNKSGPFVGSEFSFEDFTATELNKFKYRYLKSEACDTLTCDVVERLPLYSNSGYTKQIAWIDQKDYQIRKVEFYDRRGDLLKILTFSGYRQYEGNVWRAHSMLMDNVQTNKQSHLIYSNYTFNVGLTDNDFVKGRLSRLR